VSSILRGLVEPDNVNFFAGTAHRTQPWKNGLGVSQLIAEVPWRAGFDAVLWQVSVTAIGSDCPFSNLPGLDRQFTVIEGDGVELVSVDDTTGVASRQLVQRHRVPYAFPGDWRTTCRLLGGPVRVLNIMTRRGRFDATVEIITADREIRLEKTSSEVLVAVDLHSLDTWLLDRADAEHHTVVPGPGIRNVALVRIRAA
jgi:environmental stress-induced protein Ves